MTASSLFDRLGGSNGVRAIVNDILLNHLENPTINKRYLPLLDDEAHKDQVVTHLCHFLEAGIGGPERYAGKSMPDAHRGMNITAEEYMAAIDDIMNALTKNGVDEGSRNEILAILYAIKGEIIRL